ncbi:3'-5' exonuclease [Streptomyces anulatus]|uniref:3'-5' exonuclease n=1 Tax=Streptomyces anulatus TaxID=1892 RepID=UPI00341AB3F6
MATLAFIDTETTGLDPDRHAVWEIAVILRNPDQPDWEHHWQIRQTELHLTRVAQPEALDIGRYYDRMVIPADYFVGQMGGDGKPVGMSHKTLAYDLTRILDGAVLVGSNPAFDAAFLRVFLDGNTPWHYRTIDVATLAAGFMWAQEPELMAKDTKPISSRWLSRQVGVEPPGDDVAHTALGDARWARDVYDAITRGGQR